MAQSTSNNNIGAHDVLMGRGGATNNNSGNIRFREIVLSKQLVYLDSKKKEKKAIAQECVDSVHANGGRFLRRDDATGCWTEVPLKKAVTKASQCLREQLDVRNKRLRDSKMGHSLAGDENLQRSKKRQKVVTGKVATTSPALVSLTGDGSGVPELQEEMPSAANFNYAPPPVSTNDCDFLAEV